MSWDEPTTPQQGDQVKMKEIVNKLVIVRPLEYKEKLITKPKPDGGEAIFADLAVFDQDGGNSATIYRHVLIMNGYLVGAFKGSVANKSPLLGTIYEGVNTKGNPPFHFKSLTGVPKARAIGDAWWATHETEFMTQPDAFGEPEDKPKSNLEQMRQENPWLNSDEAPF